MKPGGAKQIHLQAERYEDPIPEFDPSPWFFVPMLGGFVVAVVLMLMGRG